jgi:EAL and modified HD-GYP domain-containing signal transduction protein
MARQPVFDCSLRVYGYELLFRAAAENFARITDADRAARAMLDNSVLWGLERVCDGKRALVNCTRDVITSRQIELLPPTRTVVEILEGIDPDREMIDACRGLKERGYLIALDDVTSVAEVRPYLGVAQIVKVDFRLIQPAERAALAA